MDIGTKYMDGDDAECTALELLVALQISLNVELEKLRFDLLAFHRTCRELLRRRKADLKPLLLKYFEDGFLVDEVYLYMLPGYILMTADGSGKLRKKMKLRVMKKGGFVDDGSVGGSWEDHSTGTMLV